ncbi:MAG: sigma 54-interacting transcriptional regulator [Fimbriimonadaceae bacterium]|nr:sigma 54-interacting transcriptional regulator [Fimbriimonadaceae bacterium]
MVSSILLTFTGSHDPYVKAPVAGEEQPGPILTVLKAREFDRVVLFGTPRMAEQTSATAAAVAEECPATTVEVVQLPLEDPTDYSQILAHLRRECGKIVDRDPKAALSISTASGTPQMHACWLLLAAAKEIPATLIHSRPPQFVTDDKPLVCEVDVEGTPFPRVIPSSASALFGAEPIEAGPEVAAVLQELGIIAEHPSMRAALDRAVACADYEDPVLVTGETGTGKDLFAKLVHRISGRRNGPFVVVNCAAISETLVESELFGYKRGAFTGANADKKGKFELANEGTLFLDEIGELPLAAQAKILRVIEDGLVDAVGSTRPVKVNVRIIAATNRSLGSEVAEKRFRQDLFHRINTVQIHLPPLRSRRSDISRIALLLLEAKNKTTRKQRQLSSDALMKLQSYHWPGNVRELRSTINGAFMFSHGKEILGADDIKFDDSLTPDPLANLPEPYEGFDLKQYIEDLRQRMIARALEISGENQSKAARLLGMTGANISDHVRRRASATPSSS